jgi:MFS family permease
VTTFLRVLSGICGVVVFVIGLVLSFGAILASPVGMWLVRRWTRRNDRRPSRVASLVGSVLASSVLAGLLWSVIFLLVPRPTSQELQSAVRRAKAARR